MGEGKKRYKLLEKIMAYALAVNLGIFCLYIIGAGTGILWLKILTAIIAVLISGLCLSVLFLTKELTRRRSLWMTLGACAIVFLVLLSLVLNYPSPRQPYTEQALFLLMRQI